ncbi:MAG TPA: MFS transporter [Steroidobacteraceae bacterium]|nr:MFS transporter [Steroidobacteraceae bacterium]
MNPSPRVTGRLPLSCALGLLVLIHATNYVDRMALGLLLQEIKVDLVLSDTQLGLLTGLAFAVFYALMGVPIARWADRGDRVKIISLTASVWCGMVALCGAATSFVQLLLIRVGVGVGESGCVPPAHSLIADYFERSRRARAMAIYGLGGPLGMTIGYFVGGWLNELYGWRLTFVFLGLPGLALALVAWFALAEPRRNTSFEVGTVARSSEVAPDLAATIATLWRNATFRNLMVAYTVSSFFGVGIQQWKPAFFVRTYGLETGEVGAWFALIYGSCGLAGAYLGGELASRFAARNERLQLSAIALCYSVFAVFSFATYLAPTPTLAFIAMGLGTLGLYGIAGPYFAVMQSLVPERMRATAIAVLYLAGNLVGMGLGPLGAGMISDALHATTGDMSLRWALVVLCPGYFWCAWHVWRASRTVTTELGEVERAAVHEGS